MDNERRFLTFKNYFSRRPIVIKIVPELLKVFTVDETVLLCVIDYFLNRSILQHGEPRFICPIGKLQAKFLPYIPISTFYRIIKKLRHDDVIDDVSKIGRSGSASWNLNYELILEKVQSHGLDAKHSHSEKKLRRKGKKSKISESIFENPPSTHNSFQQTPQKEQEQEKKEPLESSLDLIECVFPRDNSHGETKHSHGENSHSHGENFCELEKKRQEELEILDQFVSVRLPEAFQRRLSESRSNKSRSNVR